uniref:Uncharacterized LOC115401944 n=1 Tax=Salarias fasciatus TaxID=181472 RepID=A0A672JMH7_SALFA
MGMATRKITISCVGFVGNIFLILSITQTKFSRVKSFELFLLGLATANLEEIIIINVYDFLILQLSARTDPWSCRFLQFMTVFGEICSILFTVLISVFRYQKLRDASKRVNLSIYLDSVRSAWMMSGVCVALSALLSLPIFVIDLQGSAENVTRNNSSSCPPDFFHCGKKDCPTLNRVYKYVFLMVCHMLPLIIVTASSCLILTVLLSQRKTVTPVVSVSGSSQFCRRSKDLRLQRSTVAILAAMGLFQVDWTLYLIFQLTFSATDAPLWAEVEFFISISYTSLSPYVYGIGSNLFTVNTFKKK